MLFFRLTPSPPNSEVLKFRFLVLNFGFRPPPPLEIRLGTPLFSTDLLNHPGRFTLYKTEKELKNRCFFTKYFFRIDELNRSASRLSKSENNQPRTCTKRKLDFGEPNPEHLDVSIAESNLDKSKKNDDSVVNGNVTMQQSVTTTTKKKMRKLYTPGPHNFETNMLDTPATTVRNTNVVSSKKTYVPPYIPKLTNYKYVCIFSEKIRFFEPFRAGLVTGNYHYRKLPLPHDIFITATITGTLNFILAVTINLPI